jgi:hypothetical protein
MGSRRSTTRPRRGGRRRTPRRRPSPLRAIGGRARRLLLLLGLGILLAYPGAIAADALLAALQ